jgi:hypothetical protein
MRESLLDVASRRRWLTTVVVPNKQVEKIALIMVRFSIHASHVVFSARYALLLFVPTEPVDA